MTNVIIVELKHTTPDVLSVVLRDGDIWQGDNH